MQNHRGETHNGSGSGEAMVQQLSLECHTTALLFALVAAGRVHVDGRAKSYLLSGPNALFTLHLEKHIHTSHLPTHYLLSLMGRT